MIIKKFKKNKRFSKILEVFHPKNEIYIVLFSNSMLLRIFKEHLIYRKFIFVYISKYSGEIKIIICLP